MLHTLVLPGGEAVGSGVGEPALKQVTVTASVGSAEPGGVQAFELDATFFGQLALQPGDRLELRGGLGGIYFVRSVTTPAPGQTRVVAYDAVTKLDGTADDFLSGLEFPIALGDMARSLAAYFGLELTGTLLNADYEVPKFQYRGITGRQLMGWICQAGGRFCTACGDGLRLGWFEDSGITLAPGTEAFAYQGACTLAELAVPPVEQVVIRASQSDVGTAAGAGSALYVTGNPLLCGDNETAAQTLLDGLWGFSYTPCTVTASVCIRPGQLFWASGRLCAAVSVTEKAGRWQISAPGEAVRTENPTGATQRMAGRVTELQLGLQAVSSRMAEFSEAAAEISSLSQDVDHITAQVALLRTDEHALGKDLETLEKTAERSFAELSLRSDGLEVTVGQMEQTLDGKADARELEALTEHFRFDDEGLTITDSRTGMGITVSEDAVLFTGGSATTRITPVGMTTTDLQVENRLEMGNFAFLPRTSGNLSLRWLEK